MCGKIQHNDRYSDVVMLRLKPHLGGSDRFKRVCSMPIYEYQCQDCGHEMEKIQRMSDPVLVDCPACEQPHLKKLISAAAFRLKGSGWYETDFKQDKKRNLADTADSGHSSGADSKTSGETKSDTTTTAKSAGNDNQSKSQSATSGSKKKPAKDN